MERIGIKEIDPESYPIPLIVILGPTASGKTAAALELSEFIEIEVISCDSRQIYKYLDIGTAKPDNVELKKLKHHFIDICLPNEYYSAGIFGNDAENKAKNIFREGKLPVAVGGSGLYIKALCEGLFDDNFGKADDFTAKLEKELSEFGKEYIFENLKKIDPHSAELYSDMNPRRIIRALNYYYRTGILLSEAHSNHKKKSVTYPVYFEIQWDRNELYNRINQRTDKMFESGIIEETRKVLSMGYSSELNSLNTVGYKECTGYLSGEMKLTEAIEKTKQTTRNYAKRQITWFKKIPGINKINGNSGSTGSEIIKILNKIKFHQ